MKKLIIMSGALATGKSTFSKIISEKNNVVVFNKDTLKETLSDVFGFNNREENLLLSKGSFNIMCYILESFAKQNKPLILESNFHQKELDIIKIIVEKYNYKVLCIIFKGDFEVLFPRFQKRAKDENRHPCHLSGPITSDAFKEYLIKNNEVKYYGKQIVLNGNNFEYQKDEFLLKQIKDFIDK